jgi:Tol biopolymer transport system component
MVGTVLGHYKVLRLVGKGGMGEVYAAEDLTLGRTVAIKLLPRSLEGQPAELERFAREAKSIAALNHRAIVTLYSFEESGGTHFITMELVDGQPLAANLPSRGLPFDEVLRLGIEMADAVAAAHERGIVHRDLKPANVLVRSDGQVKILDFGLAKLRQPDTAAADLPTQALTGEGRIVGTVAYMSPEQAEGRAVDHRSDIFSLGVVLYELATGRRPFQGDTSMSILSAVLKDHPAPATTINPALPPAFARVLKTCLHKDPERRYQSAKDVRNELQTLREELDSGELARPAIAVAPARAAVRWPIVAAAAAAVAIAALAWSLWPAGSGMTPAPRVLQHTRLTSASGVESEPALSPDGKWFVYVSSAAGNSDIYLQSVGGQTAINLTKDSPATDEEPAFSPDGEQIAFRSSRDGGGLYVMGRTGEAPRRVAPDGRNPTWSPDGQALAYSSVSAVVPTSRGASGRLRTVRVDTGVVTDLTALDALHPAWSPNGRFIAFWGMGRTPDGATTTSRRDIWMIAATGGDPWRLTDDAHVDWSPTWAPDSDFVYFGSNLGGSMNLWRIADDPDTGKPASEPQAVTTPAGYVGLVHLSRSGNSLVYESRETTSNIYRSTFDATRALVGPLEPVTTGTRTFRFVDPSPDGQWLVLGTSYLQQEDLFISRADGSELRQLTTDMFNDRWPEWSPKGDVIAFYSDRSGKYEIWTITPSGQPRQITDVPDHSPLYPKWSPSGQRMTFTDISVRPAVVIFDPTKPWKEQTPDALPPAGTGSGFGTRPVWSPDETRLAGTVAGVVTIYDIAARRYTPVGDVRGQVVAWLKDGRLLVGLPAGLRLIDPGTGAGQRVAVPTFGSLSAAEARLGRDERTIFFSLATNEADIWLVTLGR